MVMSRMADSMKRSMEMEVSASLATPGVLVSRTLSRASKTSSLKAVSSSWLTPEGIVDCF